LAALEALLARGRFGETRCEDEASWLCGRFGIARQLDWPVATIALYGDGVDPGEEFWLCADPVHLKLHHDQLILLAADSLSIADAEARDLVAALNRHFAVGGWHFVAPHPQRWYLQAPAAPQIRTVSLSCALGRDVNRLLPEGEDRLAWHRLFNEAQMLLHAHPVNAEREQRGALPVNSLWFWGGGRLPTASTSFQAAQSDGALLRGLCRLAGIPVMATAGGFGSDAGRDTLIELQELTVAIARSGLSGWKEALKTLEMRWFAPLAAALRTGAIGRVEIATVFDDRAMTWSTTRGATWKFWKAARPLGSLARSLAHPQ
jgi:hypothetical protein